MLQRPCVVRLLLMVHLFIKVTLYLLDIPIGMPSNVPANNNNVQYRAAVQSGEPACNYWCATLSIPMLLYDDDDAM
jgi:hypothetical protein